MNRNKVIILIALLALLISGCQESCASQTAEYWNKVNPLLDKFFDTIEIASSTSRVALAPIVQDMQDIKREVETIPVPDCAENAGERLLVGMDYFIDGFLAFMAGEETTANRDFEMGDSQMAGAIRQLKDLAAGETP